MVPGELMTAGGAHLAVVFDRSGAGWLTM